MNVDSDALYHCGKRFGIGIGIDSVQLSHVLEIERVVCTTSHKCIATVAKLHLILLNPNQIFSNGNDNLIDIPEDQTHRMDSKCFRWINGV